MKMENIKARYKFDGKCPDCGAEVTIEPEKTSNYWQVRRVFIQCPNYPYMAETYERKERAISPLSWGYYIKRPNKWVVSETISLSEQIRQDAEYMKQMADYIDGEIRGKLNGQDNPVSWDKRRVCQND